MLRPTSLAVFPRDFAILTPAFHNLAVILINKINYTPVSWSHTCVTICTVCHEFSSIIPIG